VSARFTEVEDVEAAFPLMRIEPVGGAVSSMMVSEIVELIKPERLLS
jgi:hypothetical protein